jgi:hypothetical protein
MEVNHTSYFGTGAFTKPDLHSGVLCKVIDIHPLILKNASGASRSPVNNCGEVQREPDQDMQVATPEYVTAVMSLIEGGDVSWNDADVAKVLRDAVRRQSPKSNHQESDKIPK